VNRVYEYAGGHSFAMNVIQSASMFSQGLVNFFLYVALRGVDHSKHDILWVIDTVDEPKTNNYNSGIMIN